MTAQVKCERCGEWVVAFSPMPHSCKPEDKPVAYMQTYTDKMGKTLYTFTHERINDTDVPLYQRPKKED